MHLFQKESNAMIKESIAEEPREAILEKQTRKISKHAKAVFSEINRDIPCTKFLQARDDEIIAAMTEEDANESSTWINHCRAEDLMGKFDEKEDPIRNPKKKLFTKMAQDNRTRDSYSQDGGFVWRRWINVEKSPTCKLSKEEVTDHFGSIWDPPILDRDGFQLEERWRLEPLEEFIGKEELLNQRWLEFAASEKNVCKEVSSRAILSAIGFDGVGYQMMRLGGTGTNSASEWHISRATVCQLWDIPMKCLNLASTFL
jgi:hypothetical protein